VGEGSASCPGRSLPLGKTRYALYRRLGEPQGRSGQVQKISPPPGFDPRTVQPVASRYTDYATRPTTHCKGARLLFHLITYMDINILIMTPLDERPARLAEASTTHNIRKRRDIHAPDRIRTRNPSKRAATGLLLRPRDHRDWLSDRMQSENLLPLYCCYLPVLDVNR